MSNLLNNVLNDVQHWRDRAEEIRIQAADMRDEIARRQMLAIAYGYDRFAKRAEQRSKSVEGLSTVRLVSTCLQICLTQRYQR